MSHDMTSEELNGLLQLRNEKLWEVVGEIRAVLREDIPTYVEREVKTAFLSAPEVAEGMSADDVRSLKNQARELGVKTADDIDADLDNQAVWMAVPDEVENVKALVEATDIWAIVSRATDALTGLLQERQLGSEAPAYSAPVYFVGRRYFPSLAEHYWKLIHELRALQNQQESAKVTAKRERLLAKWDES